MQVLAGTKTIAYTLLSLSPVTKTRHLYPNLGVAKENKPNKEDVAVTQLSKIHTMG